MTRTALIIAIRSALLAVMAARGQPIPVRQDYQPTAQGIPSGLTLYVHPVSERRYGFSERSQVWNSETEQFDRVQAQQIETVLQFSAAGPQNPADDAEWTLTDWVQAAAMALGSDDCLAALWADGIGMTRVTEVRIMYALDDKDQHEGSPSFDATFTHRDIVVDVLPAVTDFEVDIQRV